MVCAAIAAKGLFTVTTNKQFIDHHRPKIREFKPRSGPRTQGLPVGQYFIILENENGFVVYNTVLRVPLIEKTFTEVKDSYDFCKKLIEHYITPKDDFLYILADEKFAKHVFRMTRYSIPDGMKIYEGIRSFDKLDQIKRADLAFILDN